MLIPQNLEVYAGQSIVRSLDLYMGQGITTVETQTTHDFLIFTVGLTEPFQFVVPFTWLKGYGWSKDYLIITCLGDLLAAKIPMQSRDPQILWGTWGKVLHFCYHWRDTLEINKNSTNVQTWVTFFYELSRTKNCRELISNDCIWHISFKYYLISGVLF